MPSNPPQHVPRSQLNKPERSRVNHDNSKAVAIRKTNKWRVYSEMLRKEFPICQSPGCHDWSTSVHHIKPLEQFPDLAFAVTNTIPLCETHHRQHDKATEQQSEELRDHWAPQHEEQGYE